MTEVQQAAIARADAAMKPALDLYAARCRLMYLVCGMPLRDLDRVNAIIDALSQDDLRRVAAFAEGLAEWASSEASSPDVCESKG